jgi:membrane protein DedA with SNARE-associated domain/rhodanese-related sulfurtransferase
MLRMEKLLQFITVHGPLIIFLVAFVDELGFPFPSEFMFLRVGALVALAKFNLGWALVLPIAGTLLADVGLYYIGRRWGAQCLHLLYRFSLEPEAVSKRREGIFGRYGLRFQLVSKFLPMSMVPPILSGRTRTSLLRFLIYTTAGTVFWAALYTAVGYLFHKQIDSIIRTTSHATGTVALIAGVLFAAYIVYKFIRRRRILRLHHEKRIDPENLKAIMDAGHPAVIMDVRNREAIIAFPYVIPGAIQIPVEELVQRENEIPKDKDLVLYSSSTSDASSARVALMINEKGVEKVHPLSGGIEAWHELNYPVKKHPIPPELPPASKPEEPPAAVQASA